MKTAILVDGGFYRRRAQIVLGDIPAKDRAIELANYCKRHLNSHGEHNNDLYRIFYYDCPPASKRLFHPFLQKQVDLSKTDLYIWMNEFLTELKKKRKFAIRLGKLAEEQAHYTIRSDVVKKLCRGSISFSDLQDSLRIHAYIPRHTPLYKGLSVCSSCNLHSELHSGSLPEYLRVPVSSHK